MSSPSPSCLPPLSSAVLLLPPENFKVYLQDEERLERRERVQLAQGGRCGDNDFNARREARKGEKENDDDATGARGSRPAAAALGPCEDRSAESEAAAKVNKSVGWWVCRTHARGRFHVHSCLYTGEFCRYQHQTPPACGMHGWSWSTALAPWQVGHVYGISLPRNTKRYCCSALLPAVLPHWRL